MKLQFKLDIILRTNATQIICKQMQKAATVIIMINNLPNSSVSSLIIFAKNSTYLAVAQNEVRQTNINVLRFLILSLNNIQLFGYHFFLLIYCSIHYFCTYIFQVLYKEKVSSLQLSTPKINGFNWK